MNEHASNTELEANGPRIRRSQVRGYHRAPERGDLVIDLSGVSKLDVMSLGLLLTAQQNATKEGRVVWLAGLHVQLWQALELLGLGHLFKAFPIPQASAA